MLNADTEIERELLARNEKENLQTRNSSVKIHFVMKSCEFITSFSLSLCLSFPLSFPKRVYCLHSFSDRNHSRREEKKMQIEEDRIKNIRRRPDDVPRATMQSNALEFKMNDIFN